MVDLIEILLRILTFFSRLFSKRTQFHRLHSDKLGRTLRSWLESDYYLSPILDPKNLPESPEDVINKVEPPPGIPLSYLLPSVLQHLETGYQKEYKKLKTLEKQIEEHNRRVKSLLDKLHNKLKHELELPDAVGARKENYAYYRRMVNMSLKK